MLHACHGCLCTLLVARQRDYLCGDLVWSGKGVDVSSLTHQSCVQAAFSLESGTALDAMVVTHPVWFDPTCIEMLAQAATRVFELRPEQLLLCPEPVAAGIMLRGAVGDVQLIIDQGGGTNDQTKLVRVKFDGVERHVYVLANTHDRDLGSERLTHQMWDTLVDDSRTEVEEAASRTEADIRQVMERAKVEISKKYGRGEVFVSALVNGAGELEIRSTIPRCPPLRFDFQRLNGVLQEHFSRLLRATRKLVAPTDAELAAGGCACSLHHWGHVHSHSHRAVAIRILRAALDATNPLWTVCMLLRCASLIMSYALLCR